MSDAENKERFPSRKNPRMRKYDYSHPNYYFVTICTKEKRCIFGSTEKLNSYGRIAEQGLRNIEKHFPSVKLDKYVVMPNHVHIILVLLERDTELPVVVGQYKAFVSKQIHETGQKLTVWQSSFHDHVIRDQKGYEQIWRYIDANPMNWQKDCFYCE